MKGRIYFECGTGKNWNIVNYFIGQNGKLSVYAEVELPKYASPDYGYKTMKQAIFKFTSFEEAADLSFICDEWACAMDPDAEADCSVYLEIMRTEVETKGTDRIRTYIQNVILTKAEY